jgi:hypothetical protein
MSKVLKWIFGILAVLVVVAVVVGVGFLVVSHWGGTYRMMGARSFQPYDDGRVRPWKDAPQFEMPMHPGWDTPFDRRGRIPLQRFGGFFPLGMIFSTLCFGALVFFAVLGIILLIRGGKNGKKQAEGSKYVAAAPVTSEAPIAEVGTVDETPDQVTATCSNCGHEVQEAWSHCPYCGQNLK